jgi:hypothetical protein
MIPTMVRCIKRRNLFSPEQVQEKHLAAGPHANFKQALRTDRPAGHYLHTPGITNFAPVALDFVQDDLANRLFFTEHDLALLIPGFKRRENLEFIPHFQAMLAAHGDNDDAFRRHRKDLADHIVCQGLAASEQWNRNTRDICHHEVGGFDRGFAERISTLVLIAMIVLPEPVFFRETAPGQLPVLGRLHNADLAASGGP